MLHKIPCDHPLWKLFSRLVHEVFYGPLRMPDPPLADYLTDMLTSFVHMDNLYRIRDARGRRLEEVAQMLWEADVLLGAEGFAREREVHKHIGDFTLFWTGVYPEMLRLLRAQLRKDALLDYVQQGKRSYYIASTFTHGPYGREAPLLRRLSQHFESCVFGLNLVRAEWEELAGESFRKFREAVSSPPAGLRN